MEAICPVCKNLEPEHFGSWTSEEPVYLLNIERRNLIQSSASGCETCLIINEARKKVGSGLEMYRSFVTIFTGKIGDPLRFELANRGRDPYELCSKDFSERVFPYRVFATERLVRRFPRQVHLY